MHLLHRLVYPITRLLSPSSPAPCSSSPDPNADIPSHLQTLLPPKKYSHLHASNYAIPDSPHRHSWI